MVWLNPKLEISGILSWMCRVSRFFFFENAVRFFENSSCYISPKTLAIRLEVHHGMESSLGWCYGPRERGNSWETPVEFQLSVGNQDGWCGGKWACFPKIPGLKRSWEIIPIRWWLFLSQATCGFISLGTTPIWKENPSAHPVYSPANHTFVPLSILHITTSTTVL